MPLPNTFTLLVLGQGSTGLDVVAWALEHTERVLSVTVYGGGSSEPTEATRALEERGFRGAAMSAVRAAVERTKEMGKAK